MSDNAPLLLESLSLGSARGGKKQEQAVTFDIVRALTEADLEDIVNPPAVADAPCIIREIKAQHHTLASLIAMGTSGVEISLLTGYSPSYISNIKNDPAMAELIAYYATQEEQRRVDGMRRLHDLGVAGIEELQQRIDSEPEKWTKRELMELVTLGLIAPQKAALGVGNGQGNGNGGGNSLAINVNFVSAKGNDRIEQGIRAGNVIEGEIVR